MFHEATREVSLLREVRTANIVLIRKFGNPPEECAYYRPISLLNNASKILAKVLANRLFQVIEKIITPDHSRFMAHRQK